MNTYYSEVLNTTFGLIGNKLAELIEGEWCLVDIKKSENKIVLSKIRNMLIINNRG